MDYAHASDQQLDAQFSGGLDVAIAEYIESRLRDVHTMLPGRIVSFNATKQTAVVQPCIQRIFIAAGAVNLPLCMDVPVVFPGGGGFFLTFCPAEGDECVLQFSERAIDFWYQNGGVQLPAEYQLHDLSDAIATVGLNSQPNVIQNLCTTGAELRTRDRSTYVRVEAGTITLHAASIVLDGPVTATQTITAAGDVTADGTSVHTHLHSGVQAGQVNTGEPV
jgi:hypothetical protein